MKLDSGARHAGRRLLNILLPQAMKRRAETAEIAEWRSGSALGDAIGPWLKVDNLEAVLIYPAPKGGWHADILLHNVPPGIPNTIGTPVATPLPTRQMAQDHAIELLVGVIVASEKPYDGPAQPAFLFHGNPIHLQFDLLAKSFPTLQPFESEQAAIDALRELEAAVFPNGISSQSFDTLNRRKFGEFLIVVHLAALAGVFRYPVLQPQPPGDPNTMH